MKALRPISLSICILTSCVVRRFHSKNPERETLSPPWKPWVRLWESVVYTNLQNGPKLFDGFSAGAAYQTIRTFIQELSGEYSGPVVVPHNAEVSTQSPEHAKKRFRITALYQKAPRAFKDRLEGFIGALAPLLGSSSRRPTRSNIIRDESWHVHDSACESP